ncbi:MAG: carboxymuconolactone decarboxylase family protein [Caldilinea sp.]
MTFIHTIPEDQAEAAVKKMYEENVAEFGYLPNYVQAFSLRPDVMAAWGQFLGTLRREMDARRYELVVTLAAARALHSSYCMLAHGSVMLQELFSPEQLTRIAHDDQTADLTPAEVAMMAFAEQIVVDATAVTQSHIDTLHQHGFTDAEIFDITTTAAARCFFSKTLDALGAEPDENFMALDGNLRQALTVGRPIREQ